MREHQDFLGPSDNEVAEYTNEDFAWLTYETVFNKRQFRKTNQKKPMPTYAVDCRDVNIWIRDGIDPDSLSAICESFFPDHTKQQITNISNATWPWKDGYVEGARPDPLTTPSQSVAPRSQIQIFLPVKVVMPFNNRDNGGEYALGYSFEHGYSKTKLTHCWDFWRTASRSVVVRLSRVKDIGASWSPLEADVGDWDYPNNDHSPSMLEDGRFKNEIGQKDSLLNQTIKQNHFSLKTGVTYVGFQSQSGAQVGKNFIGDWKLACLRSDYAAAQAKLLEKNSTDWNKFILVLTELMTISERIVYERGGAIPQKYKGCPDAISLRDIQPLGGENIFVPPLSIPFLTPTFNKVAGGEFAHFLTNDESSRSWIDFWANNFADPIGRAKVLFLLDYGLQHENPNPQNYLLEFTRPQEGQLPKIIRVVIRDLEDAQLHREWAWAVHGPESGDPPSGSMSDEVASQLAAAFSTNRHLAAQFEDSALRESETGSTKPEFGQPGAQLLWERFTAFYARDKLMKMPPHLKAEQDKLLQILDIWGAAHNASYVTTLEQALGCELLTIDWTKYVDLAASKEQAGDKTFREWEDSASVAVQAHLASNNGQKQIREYRNRNCKPVKPLESRRFSDKFGPHRWGAVQFTSNDTSQTWTRVTDRDGWLHFYTEAAPQGEFNVLPPLPTAEQRHPVQGPPSPKANRPNDRPPSRKGKERVWDSESDDQDDADG